MPPDAEEEGWQLVEASDSSHVSVVGPKVGLLVRGPLQVWSHRVTWIYIFERLVLLRVPDPTACSPVSFQLQTSGSWCWKWQLTVHSKGILWLCMWWDFVSSRAEGGRLDNASTGSHIVEV